MFIKCVATVIRFEVMKIKKIKFSGSDVIPAQGDCPLVLPCAKGKFKFYNNPLTDTKNVDTIKVENGEY